MADGSTDPCLDELAVLELARGRTSVVSPDPHLAHLEACAECRQLVAAMAGVLPAPAADSRYELRTCLGSGGFGAVYEAWDRRLRRAVALKLLHDVDEAGEARIRREARALAGMSHGNVVTVFDVGRLDGELFVAMEKLDGGDLKQWLVTDPSPEAILRAFRAAAEGLLVAHRAGLVHGDFKAENVLRGADGRIAIADFGLAESARASTADDAAPGSERSALAGTPSHLAPEVVRGAEKTPASDQYAFGIALRQALRGRGSRRIRRAVEAMTATDPRRRYASTAAMLAAIAPRPRRWPVVVAAVVPIAIAGLGFAGPAPSRMTDAANAAPMPTPRCDGAGNGLHEAVAPEWEAALARARLQIEEGDHAVAIPTLTSLAAEAGRRGWLCAEGRARFELGVALSLDGGPDAEHAFAAAALAGEAIDFDGLAVQAWYRATSHALRRGDVEAAARYLRFARAYADRRPELRGQFSAMIAAASGDLAEARGDYAQASEFLTVALRDAAASDERGKYALSLGHVLLRLDRADEAMDAALAAKVAFEADGGIKELPATYDLLGRIATVRGDHEAAVDYGTQGLDALASLGMETSLNFAIALNVRGVARTEAGDHSGARRDLLRAAERYEAVLGEESPTTGNALYALGALEHAAGNDTRALAFLDRAQPLADASGNAHFAATVRLATCASEHALAQATAAQTCALAHRQLTEILPADHHSVVEAQKLVTASSR